MRVLLVSPWDRRRRRYRSLLSALISYAPLTLPTLAALVPEELGAEIVVYDEISDRKLPVGPFDIVGITVIAPESVRAYELADYYRGLGSFTVLGGYHATFMQEEALMHADAIVTGEG
ncbi:MAG: radical SAM protein, partial [Clostridiales bacterium]|nr:radical SAM protein [Clostridiales bacterium]